VPVAVVHDVLADRSGKTGIDDPQAQPRLARRLGGRIREARDVPRENDAGMVRVARHRRAEGLQGEQLRTQHRVDRGQGERPFEVTREVYGGRGGCGDPDLAHAGDVPGQQGLAVRTGLTAPQCPAFGRHH
jgi:hypothetical protein